MSLQIIQSLQTELEATLSSQGVIVFFSRMLGEDYGRYLDNGTIFINHRLQGNDEEILKVTAHEAVHHLQLTKKILYVNSISGYSPFLIVHRLLQPTVLIGEQSHVCIIKFFPF